MNETDHQGGPPGPPGPPDGNDGMKYFKYVICIVNILLHGLGSYLLIVWYKTERRKPQKLLMINLALTELLINIVALVRDVLNSVDLFKWFIVLNATTTTGLYWMVILAMFYITGDRLLAVLLNIKYDSYCSNGKTIVLISVTAVLGVILSIVIGALEYYRKVHMETLIVYVNPIISIIYLIFALVTYSVLFAKYLQSRRNMRRNPTDNNTLSPWKAFLGSRFFIPVLLIGSYLLLTVIPALVRTAYTWDMKRNQTANVEHSASLDVNIAYEVLSKLSYTVDAIIYIYLTKPVRNILLTRLRCSGGDTGNNHKMVTKEMNIPSNSQGVKSTQT